MRFKFYEYIRRFQYLIYVVFRFWGITFTFAYPLLWGLLVQNIIDNNVEKLPLAITLVILVKVTQVIFSNYNLYFSAKLKESMECELKKKMMATELNFTFERLQSINAGQFISKFHSDVVEIAKFWIDTIPNMVTSFTLAILMGWFVIEKSMIVFIVVILASVLSLITNHVMGNKYHNKYKETRVNADNYFTMMYQTLSAIIEIKVQGIKEKVLRNNSKIFDDVRKEETKLFSIEYCAEVISGFWDTLIFCVALFLMVSDIVSGKSNIAYFITLFAYLPLLSSNIISLGKIMMNLGSYNTSLQRIDELLHPDCESIENFGSITFDEAFHSLTFKDITYVYPRSSTKSLNEINLVINQGDKLAVVGTSGSGKSTLFRIATYLIIPKTGFVRLNGYNYEELTERSIRNNITVVSQNPFFLNESIRNNLNIGTKKIISDKEISKLLYEIGLDQYAENLDYVISEKNDNLSGGEKQRLAIVRAAIMDIPVIIFDEPYSAQDNESIERTVRFVEKYTVGKVVIISSHRISFVQNCSRIVVMQAGVIIDMGTHEELVSRCSLYQELCSKESVF